MTNSVNTPLTTEPVAAVRVLATCSGGTCPTVYESDRGTLLVQGYTVSAADGVQLPAGEQLVEIPRDLLARAFEAAERS